MYSFRVPKANKSYCSLSIYYALYMHYLIKFSQPSILSLFSFFFFCCTFGMWDLSSPTRDGTQLLALEGRVLTTGPPGKSAIILIFRKKKKKTVSEKIEFSSVQSLSRVRHFVTPWTIAHQASLSIRVFSNESTLHMRWPKYCSFSFRIIPSKEHPGLISFRMYLLILFIKWSIFLANSTSFLTT